MRRPTWSSPLAAIPLAVLSLAAAPGCGGRPAEPRVVEKVAMDAPSVDDRGDGGGDRKEEAAAAPAEIAAADGAPPPPPSAAAPMREAAAGGTVAKARKGDVDMAKPKPEAEPEPPKFDPTIQSGLLTAGAFDDNANPGVLERFLGGFAQHPELGAFASAMLGSKTIVTVRDEKGQPLGDAVVTFTPASGQGKALRTRSDGRVIHVAPWDGEAPKKIEVTKGAAKISRELPGPIDATEITLPGAAAAAPKALDVALVIDATGSMGDEIEYLKVELRGIAESIAADNPGIDQRYALVVYRDTSDDYVTRAFPFTSDLDRFVADLGAQSAGGGGDYPEAMDRAMVDASELEWRSGDVARVAFLVADAPPHPQDYRRTFDAIDSLRARGVAIYPVAASGVAGEAEVVMRIGAVLSGAFYIWLTDDSGVGGGHAEPHVPCYFVQRLAQVMKRAVRDELAGSHTDPDPSQVLRTVGRPKAGVCVAP